MDPSNAVRQVEEILTLKDQYYKDVIEMKTPQLFNRLSRISGTHTHNQLIEVKKCLSFTISYAKLHPDELNNVMLEFTFPLDYPSDSTCCVRVFNGHEHEQEYESCTLRIQEYLKSFCGYECVELTLDWIAQNKDTCLLDNTNDDSNNSKKQTEDGSNERDRDVKVKCYVLRYNHLLEGAEHKKEKAMLTTAKKAKLQGGLLWGTPGIVIIVPPSTEDDAKEYASECRNIGKRVADGGAEEISLPLCGIEEAGLGGLAQQKRGGKLQGLDTAALRSACGGDEDLLRLVLGVN